MLETKLEATYVLYQNGQAMIVSKEEWEGSWKRWWKRITSDKSRE